MGAAPVSGIRCCRVRISPGRASAGTLRPTTAATRRASSAWSAPGTRTSGRRRTPTWRGSRSRSVTIRTKGRRAFQRRTEASRSARAGSWSRSRQNRSHSDHGLVPVSKQRWVQVRASRSSSGPPTATRKGRGPPSGRPRETQVRAEGGDDHGVADQPEPPPPRPRPRRADRVGAERDEVVGEQHAGHPQQLVRAEVGRVDRAGAEAGCVEPDQGQVGLAASGGRGGEHAVGESSAVAVVAAAGLRTRRDVDPAQQLELLGARERTGRHVTRCGLVGPRQPRRRTSLAQVRDPGVGAGRRAGTDGGQRSRSRRAVSRSRPRHGLVAGTLGGLARHHRQRVERRTELELGADPVGVAPLLVVGGPAGPQVLDVTDDVDAAALDPVDPELGRAPRRSRSGREAAAPAPPCGRPAPPARAARG